MSDLIGRMVGVYKIEEKIGAGGYSDVYLAYDTANHRRVALKLLRLDHNSDRRKVERFWNGGQSARALVHPHIVPVYDAGLAGSHYYIAMEHLKGGSIEELLHQRNSPPTLEMGLRYVEQIASAIDFAHSKGVIHRDIKPSNILLSADYRTAKLTDFGIALLPGRETLTEYGTLVGTLEYISPEQIRGRTADARSDIYSLGITAFQLLSGVLPYDGPPAAVLYNHVHTPPPSIHHINGSLPKGITRPINKSLAKEPQRRYATATAFANDLYRVGGHKTRAESKPTAGRKHANWSLWAGLAVTALIVTLLAFSNRFLTDPFPSTEASITATASIEVGNSTKVPADAPTSTALAVLPVTSTSQPTATTTPTGTLSRTGTIEPTPATSRTPTPPEPGTIAVLAPQNGANILRNEGIQTFSWAWSRPLAANESFELRFYPEGSDEFIAPFGWHKQSSLSDIDLNNLPAGRYNWVVVVVRGTDGRWEADVAVSSATSLTWGR